MYTILVIDDRLENFTFIQHILDADRYRLIYAINGQDGIELAMQDFPQLILLDMRMPRLTGWDIAHSLKTNERTQTIPIICISSPSPGDREKALTIGCAEFISRPFDIHTLRGVVQQHLELSRPLYFSNQ